MARVVKIDSAESWNFYVSQAKNQNCPVSLSSSYHFRFLVAKMKSDLDPRPMKESRS